VQRREEDNTPSDGHAREVEPPPANDNVDDAGGAERDVAAEEAFLRGLLARGEAARAVNGKLPPGALYEIVEEPPGRLPKVIRRRFSH
jgi:hypothetical protein